MKTRYLLPLVAVTAVLAGLSLKPVLHAQQPTPAGVGTAAGSPGRDGRFPLLRRALRRLHATDDQKKAALAVLRNHQPAIRPLVENLVRERDALRALSKAPAIDEAAIRAQSARVAAVEADLAVQKAYLQHDLRAIATPDQLGILDDMQADREERRAAFLRCVNAWMADS